MSEQKIRVGITQGDINGIGPEVIIKTFMNPEMLELCTPVVYSSQRTISYHRKALGIEEFNFTTLRESDPIQQRRLNVVNCYEEEVTIELGKPSEIAGKYALKSLEAACDALTKNKIDVLVTAPVNKHTIKSEQFQFTGHTEYLASRFGNGKALMLMIADKLKVALVTGHVPLSKIAQEITPEKLNEKINMLHKSLAEDFQIRKPRIAVLGLNPHAGDTGTIGKEELEIITPAVSKARENNMMVYGPYAADGFFGTGEQNKFDAVLAMYHDQGLVPFKTLAFDNGVNYTAGLSIIRTSPDHGTGYDLAGKNKASEESFRNAVYAACDIYKTRQEYNELSSNPLKTSTLKKGELER